MEGQEGQERQPEKPKAPQWAITPQPAEASRQVAAVAQQAIATRPKQKAEKQDAQEATAVQPAQKPAEAKKEAVAKGPKPKITYDDFARLDLRVAKILDAEPVAGSDKLLKLKIRVGTEERQLVAGIAQHYAPDELLGKKIIIIANLEPRKIRGVESNGMLLAAAKEEDGKLVGLCLATVDDAEFPDGSALS